jgi:hypothetical protein
MGLFVSLAKESAERKYRILSKDELTLLIYNMCKSTMAKWCFPLRNPETVSQEEINKFLDNADFTIKKIRMNYPSLRRSFDVPYDFYLRGIYRYAEKLEENIGTNMDKVLFETVIGKLYGDDAKCISNLHMKANDNGVFDFTFNKTIKSNFFDSNTTNIMNAILSTYSKCKFGSIIVSSYGKDNKSGHRTLIYIENTDNVLNIYYYDPHGSSEYSWSNKLNVFESIKIVFEGMKELMGNFGIKDIIVNKFETICLFGIQSLSYKYDIGMCQIFSSLWLYSVTKIIAEATKNNFILPKTADWIYLVDDYFISQFNAKQRYNAIILFVSKLFNFYVRNNPSYTKELEKYNDYLLKNNTDEIIEFEIPYETKSPEDIKEMEDYIVSVAKKGIAAKRKEEAEIERGILPVKTKKRIAEIPVYDEYEEYSKRVKKQKKKEEEYEKSFKSYLPFSKRPLFQECSSDSQCLSGCCSKSEFEGGSYCNEQSACKK